MQPIAIDLGEILEGRLEGPPGGGVVGTEHITLVGTQHASLGGAQYTPLVGTQHAALVGALGDVAVSVGALSDEGAVLGGILDHEGVDVAEAAVLVGAVHAASIVGGQQVGGEVVAIGVGGDPQVVVE